MPVRLALYGCWHPHALGIVRRVAEYPAEFSLLGCWDSDPATLESFVQRGREFLPDLQPLGSAEELLGLPLEGVVVDGRVDENVAAARAVVEHGLPVLLEKPAGTDVAAFRELADLAQRKHLHVQLAYLFRYLPSVQRMLAAWRAGELGQPYLLRARLPKPLGEYDEFVRDLGRYPGGIFFEMAGHMLDLALTIFGPPRRVLSCLQHSYAERSGAFVDQGAAILEFAHGQALLDVPALEVVPFTRRFELFGTGGALVIPHLGSGHLPGVGPPQIEVCLAGESTWRQEALPDEPLQLADLREFAAVVCDGKTPDYSIEHDLAVQETLVQASGMA